MLWSVLFCSSVIWVGAMVRVITSMPPDFSAASIFAESLKSLRSTLLLLILSRPS
jgi:hypothetical protein